jgi:hypothetical protein
VLYLFTLAQLILLFFECAFKLTIQTQNAVIFSSQCLNLFP